MTGYRVRHPQHGKQEEECSCGQQEFLNLLQLSWGEKGSKTALEHPGVVVLHILGGEFPLSQTVASSLARAKVAAFFIKMPYYGERRSPDSSRRMLSRNPRETA